MFVQLDSLKMRRLWFICQTGTGTAPSTSVQELAEDYKLLEPLFR